MKTILIEYTNCFNIIDIINSKYIKAIINSLYKQLKITITYINNIILAIVKLLKLAQYQS